MLETLASRFKITLSEIDSGWSKHLAIPLSHHSVALSARGPFPIKADIILCELYRGPFLIII